MNDQVAGTTSKTTGVVLRPVFPSSGNRPALSGKSAAVLPFKHKRTRTLPTSVAPRDDHPRALRARLSGDIPYEVLQQSLLAAGLVLKQDRHGLFITRRQVAE
jgi:hypothetical protein